VPATPTTAPAQNDTEARIAAIWREILNLPQVGTQDNFFDLGGHSLLAVRLHRLLCETFELDLAVTDTFRFPTVQSMAAHITSLQQPAQSENGGLSRAEMRAAKRLERQRR
jgi:acyl carrier protein